MPLYALGQHQPVTLGAYWLAPGAHAIGKVVLGTNVGIWFGAVLRGDNETITIGAGSNVQEGAMIHTDMGYPVTIGAGCTIGHHAIIHGCTIGNNCLVGANALVTEGKEFPDGSLIVGSPARLVRPLDDETIAGLKKSAESYVANWQRFAREMKLV